MVKYVGLLSHTKPDLRVLQIEAGSSNATKAIAENLVSKGYNDCQFHCTGITADTLNEVGKSLPSRKELITFRQLNIKEDPQGQGFQSGYYDLIMVVDPPYATPRLDEVTQNMRKLLKAGGRLLTQTSTHPDHGRLRGIAPSVRNCQYLPFPVVPYGSSDFL